MKNGAWIPRSSVAGAAVNGVTFRRVDVGAAAETDPAQDDVEPVGGVTLMLSSGRIGWVGLTATRSARSARSPAGRPSAACRPRLSVGATVMIERLQSEPEHRARADRRDRPRNDGALGSVKDSTLRQVDAQHREPEEGRLEQRLLVDRGEPRRRLEEVLLRAQQRAADRDRLAGPGGQPELACELGVDPLAVGDEVRVAVLVARAGDQRRPLACEGLRPVERLRDLMSRRR